MNGNRSGIELPMHPTVLLRATLIVAALAVGSGAVLADYGALVAESCPESPEVRYFPVGTFGPRNSDLFVREWYSKHLVAMEEPSLSCGVLEDTETYRFLWLRTFHNPVAVRVFRRGYDYGLEAVILDGAGGYNPGHVSRRVTRALSHDEWQTVIARLEGVQFWQMASKNYDLGFDGAQWIVEARRDGRYHIVDRWTGTDHGLESVGRLFLNLADLNAVGPVY
jgi:hypothetical protein